MLFPFGSLGYFHRPTDGKRSRKTFEARNFVGITVGRSNFCNGLGFYNPDVQSFSMSSDYVLDSDRGVADAFPSLVYDGGLQLSLWARDTSILARPRVLRPTPRPCCPSSDHGHSHLQATTNLSPDG